MSNRLALLSKKGCSPQSLSQGEKELFTLQTLRREATHSILFESGITFVNESGKKELPLAKEVLTRLKRARVNALSISAEDLSLGIKQLQTWQRDSEIDFISSNIVSVSDEKPLFVEFKEYPLGELTLTVFGIAGPTKKKSHTHSDFKILDPERTMNRILNALDDRPRIVVLLHSLPVKELMRLRRKLPRVQIFLGGILGESTGVIEQWSGSQIYANPFGEGESITALRLANNPVATRFFNFAAAKNFEKARKELITRMNNKNKTLNESERSQMQDWYSVPQAADSLTLEFDSKTVFIDEK